jgi:DNA-directed RNA polymerase
VPQELPGDLYRYVGSHVWERIRASVAAIPEDAKANAEQVMETLKQMRDAISELPEGHPERIKFIDTIRAYRDAHSKDINDASPMYWNKIQDNKHIRKLVKRNTMTLPYGGTSYGLGEQQCSDARKHGIPLLNYMEHRWGYYLGREVFSGAKDCLRRPMQLLKKFEEAGKIAEERGEFLKFTVPFTNFPMVQYYTEGVTKKVWVQYGPPIGEKLSTGYYANTFQMHICFVEDQVVAAGRQSVAAAPNIIHSLDAAHLIMVVAAADYGVTTIHDSYGALLADMPDLYPLVRQKFHELHKDNPLPSILEQIGVTMEGVDLGSLNIDEVLESEYAFV